MRQIILPAGVRRVRPFAPVFRQRLFGNMQRKVRDGGGVVEEERPGLVLANEMPRLLGNHVWRVLRSNGRPIAGRIIRIGLRGQLLMRGELGVVQLYTTVIVPKIGWIGIVSVPLTVVAVRAIEPLLEWIAFGAREPQPPLAERAGRVALGVHQFCQGDFRFRNRRLTLGLHLAVVPNPRVPGMLAGQKNAAGRRAHGVPGIMLRQAHPLRREAIDVRRANLRLTETAEVAVTQIVGENENNVGFAGCGGEPFGGQHSETADHTKKKEQTQPEISPEIHGAIYCPTVLRLQWELYERQLSSFVWPQRGSWSQYTASKS